MLIWKIERENSATFPNVSFSACTSTFICWFDCVVLSENSNITLWHWLWRSVYGFDYAKWCKTEKNFLFFFLNFGLLTLFFFALSGSIVFWQIFHFTICKNTLSLKKLSTFIWQGCRSKLTQTLFWIHSSIYSNHLATLRSSSWLASR